MTKLKGPCPLTIIVLMLFAASAWAGEGIKAAGPIGGTDIRQAQLPPPGLYVAAVNVNGRFKELLGSSQDYAVTGNFPIFGAGVLAVYPGEVFGGSLASSVFVSSGKVCFGIEPGPETCSHGRGDTYSDLLMWARHFPSSSMASQPKDPYRPYGLQVLLGLGLSFPDGKYTAGKSVNQGSNVYDIAPNVALTYTTPSLLGPRFGDATEFSMRVFYNHYTRNDETDYQSGDLLSADFSVSQRAGQWQYGLAGAGFVQLEDDKVNGLTAPNDGIGSSPCNWGRSSLTISCLAAGYGTLPSRGFSAPLARTSPRPISSSCGSVPGCCERLQLPGDRRRVGRRCTRCLRGSSRRAWHRGHRGGHVAWKAGRESWHEYIAIKRITTNDFQRHRARGSGQRDGRRSWGESSWAGLHGHRRLTAER